MSKVLICGKRTFYVKDETKDYHTQYGYIKAEDLKKPGVIKSNIGKEFYCYEPTFFDLYNKIKRGAQIIPRKDIGMIITECGLGKKSMVLESGSGSGALCLMLANIVKKVYSYEIREDFYKLVKKNIEFLGMKNVVLKNADITKGIKEKELDAVIFDLPAPWEAIEHAYGSLKPGCFLVSYSPTIPQVMDFVSRLDKFVHTQTIEISCREWEIKDRKVRPKSQAIGHSGFLTFARKL